MEIAGTQRNSNADLRNSSNKTFREASADIVTTPPNASAVVTFSKEALVKSLGARYDVTRMTSNNMKAMAQELKDNHVISEWEYADMTLIVKPIGGRYDEKKAINYQHQYAAQVEFSKKYSTPQDTQMLERLRDLLNEIAAAR